MGHYGVRVPKTLPRRTLIGTLFVPLAGHAPISAHVSYFEVINHNIINHLSISVQ